MLTLPYMAQNPLDLAAWRRLKAVRDTGPMGFAALWNEHAPTIWSVVRPLCASESEAVGWCGSFRLALEERVGMLDPVSPLGPQVGVQLFEHMAPALRGPLSSPVQVVQPDVAGVASLAPLVRLAWLVELFFDVSESVFSAEDGLLSHLRAARRCLEPVSSTDLRSSLRISLGQKAPMNILILPPGAEPNRRSWGWLWIPMVVLVVLAIGAPMVGAFREGWDWKKAARIHLQAMEEVPGFLATRSPEELSQSLRDRGLSKGMSEVPDLSSLGLVLEGGLVVPGKEPGVVLRYQKTGQRWTVQHHLRVNPRDLQEPIGVLATDEGPLSAWSEEGVTVAGWRAADGLWAVGAEAAVADVLTLGTLIRPLVGKAALP